VTAFGFRLSTVVVHAGMKRDELAMGKLVGGEPDAVKAFVSQCAGYVDYALIGQPVYAGRGRGRDESPEGGALDANGHDSYLMIKSVTADGRRVDVVVEYGREGDFETLIHRDRTPSLPMRGKAASRVYRMIFFFPTTGSKGIMIAETRGTSYAGETLLRWLSVANQRASVSVTEDGVTPVKQWDRWKHRPMIDPNRLAAIKNGASEVELQVTRRKKSGAPDSGRLVVSERDLSVSKVDAAFDLLLQWFAERAKGTKDERKAKGAFAVGELIDYRNDDEFTDGVIRFKENGKVQSVNATTIDQLFIYPLGDVTPTLQTIYYTAVQRLTPMVKELDIAISFP
jgi:hypothetical protein